VQTPRLPTHTPPNVLPSSPHAPPNILPSSPPSKATSSSSLLRPDFLRRELVLVVLPRPGGVGVGSSSRERGRNEGARLKVEGKHMEEMRASVRLGEREREGGGGDFLLPGKDPSESSESPILPVSLGFLGPLGFVCCLKERRRFEPIFSPGVFQRNGFFVFCVGVHSVHLLYRDWGPLFFLR
jgi:hypothetical protein